MGNCRRKSESEAQAGVMEKGKALFESMVDGCAAFLEWWRRVPARA